MQEGPMHVDGHCHCGQLRYEAEIDPENVLICHCTDCQSLSGSAFRTVVLANEGTFRFLAGEPRRYIKTGDSGTRRVQAFCGNCGSHIYSGPVEGELGPLGIRVGTARQRDQLVPQSEYFVGSAQSWARGCISD
jgi:hypothetical protein